MNGCPGSGVGNPIDILGDANPLRHRIALKACIKDPNIDGVLTILTPQAMTDAVAVAHDLVKTSKGTYKTLLAAFMGEDDVAEGRRILDQGRIPSYEKPEDAVRSFLNMVTYRQNLKLLSETPATIPHAFSPRTEKTQRLISKIASAGRTILTYPETKEILTHYDIPVPDGRLARNPEEARAAAAEIGFPVVMKIVSPDIIYEFDVGGVITGIHSEAEIDPAFHKIIESVQSQVPDPRIIGVYIEKVVEKRLELLIGSKKDPIFGPVIVFGMGGVAVDVFKDTNIGIPPLNMSLAQHLIDGTKISALFKGYRGTAAVDVSAIQFLLYKVAYLVMDFPEIKEMDLNPFAIDENGGIVLDAKIILDETIAEKTVKPYSHMVICPYPKEYERLFQMKNGKSVLLRPIRPEDEPMEAEMFSTFSEETKRFRFFSPIKDTTHEMLIRYTQIDYDREIAIIAELARKAERRWQALSGSSPILIMIQPNTRSLWAIRGVGKAWAR